MTLPRARLVATRAYASTSLSISHTESIRIRTLPSSTSLAMYLAASLEGGVLIMM